MNNQSKTVVTPVKQITDTPEGAREACLVVIYGADLGKKFNLDTPSLVIGRSSKADIQIDQDSVSRNHAKIVNAGNRVTIRDLGSTNGSYVNDQLVDEWVLRDGDLIKIGRTILKFLSSGNVENAYHEEIYRLTTVDGLTQTYNKRYFIEAIEKELSRAQRYERDLSLLMFDLDHFKRVNDTYGHLAGDHVLKHVATVIQNRIRREDILARYGGEEFVIILPEIGHANATTFAEKIRRLVERSRISFEGVEIPVTISIGVATCSDGSTLSDALVQSADDRLYDAKQDGRNCVKG